MDVCGHPSEMVLYLKPRTGMTNRLSEIAKQGTRGDSLRVLVDGPYGGLKEDKLEKLNTILIMSGGSGGGFSLAVLESTLKRLNHLKKTAEEVREEQDVRTIRVVFATRRPEVAAWYKEMTSGLIASYPADVEISVLVYLTSDQTSSSTSLPDSKLGKERKTSEPTSEEPKETLSNMSGRPDLPKIIEAVAGNSTGSGLGIAACGPASMLHDVRNAASKAQRNVLSGALDEIYLHSEPFS